MESEQTHILDKPNENTALNVLMKRENVAQSIEAYKRLVFQGRGNVPIYEVKTTLATLFDYIKTAIKEDITLEEYSDLERCLESNKPSEVLDGWDLINSWLYKKGLTKIFKPKAIL